ncbi:MAG: LamG-like jellyroll fold domain-containing protein, partial [Verrucomicrobiota bacterium]
EQVLAREKLDGSSDVYSLGVVLYEMLAGKHPWGDATTNEAMIKQVHDPLPPIRRFCENLPDDLEAILSKCLSKDRKQRYPDGNALRKDLQRVVLGLEVGGLAKGPVSGEYKARVTESGLFYVDDVARGRAKLLLKIRGFFRELWAAVVDPNREKRRALDKLATETVAARKAYKDLEAHVEELKKRQQHHLRESAKHRTDSQKAVADGNEVRVRSSTEAESYHANLALDYEQKARELGKQAEANRAVYDAIKTDLDSAADELALLDADAQRAGKLVPSRSGGSWISELGRWLKYLLAGAVIAFILVAVFGGIVLLYKMLLAERAPPPATAPPPVKPVVPPPPRIKVVQTAGVDLQRGLVLYYSFDSVKGDVVFDESGNKNDGRVFEASVLKQGVRGWGLEFDGENDYIEVPASKSLDIEGPLTIAMWVKLRALTSAQGLVTRLNYEPGADIERSYSFYLEGTGWESADAPVWGPSLQLSSSGNGAELYQVLTARRPAYGQWTHVAATWDGSPNAGAKIYLDGVECPLVTTRQSFSGTRIARCAQALRIGAKGNGGWFYNGAMDEVRIYNRAISSAEVDALYKQRGSASAGVDLQRGLVLHYAFDRDGGGVVTDQSGQGNDGRVSGAKHTSRGVSGGACEFDGVKDQITVGTESSLNFTGPFSVSAWVNPYDIGGFGSQYRTIFGKWKDWSPGDVDLRQYAFGYQLGGRLHMAIGAGRPREAVLSQATLATGRWQHVAGVYDGSHLRVYLNGILVGESNTTLTITSQPVSPMIAAAECGGWGLQFLKGKLDEVRVYNRAISAEEVTALYRMATPPSAPAPAAAPEMVLHFPFDRDEGRTVTDGSGHGNNGVNHDAAFDTGGVNGGAYRFDGENSYILVSRSASLSLGNRLTLAVWVKPDNYSDQLPVLEWSNDGRSGVHLWMHTTGYQWQGRGTGSHVVGADGVENDLQRVISVMDPPLGRWHHLALTYDGVTGQGSLYLDGNLVLSKPMSRYQPQTGFDLYVGCRPVGGPFFKGLIDDVRVYRGVLPADDIRALAAEGSVLASPAPRRESGLVLHYSFDRDEGGRVADESGSGNEATVVGAVHVRDGRIGGAYQFDGETSYIQLRDSESLKPEHLTVSAWIRPGKRYTNKNVVFFSKEQTGGAGGYVLRYFAGGLDFMIMRTGSYEPLRVTMTLESNQWYHVCGTFDGDWQRLYLNGSMIAEVERHVRINQTATAPKIGASADASPRDFFLGVIDDVRVYDRGLSADEVAQLYREGD